MSVILDIKTGKVEPWAALQTAAYSLLAAPENGNFSFDEDLHAYLLDGNPLPSVTEILKAEGFIDTRFYDDWSRERGSYVHLATQLDDLNILDEEKLDPVILPYLEAWRKFKKESGFIIQEIEKPMCNTTHKYAGTPDRLGKFKNDKRTTRCAVELHPDGKYKWIEFADRTDLYVWLSAVAVHHWKNNSLRSK